MCACTREMLKGKRLPSQGNGDNLHRQACPSGLLSQRLYSPRSSLPLPAVWSCNEIPRDFGSPSLPSPWNSVAKLNGSALPDADNPKPIIISTMAKENIFHLGGKAYRVYPLKAPWGQVRLVLTVESYLDGSLAVVAVDVSGKHPETYAVLTVNLCHPLQDETTAFFDTNNCGYLFKQLCSAGVVNPLPVSAHSGFCSYPLCEWDKAKFVPEQDR